MKPIPFAIAVAALAVSSGVGIAQYQSEKASVELLFAGSKTIIGDAIAYPAGTAEVSAGIVTLPVGAETGWHMHHAPMYARILEGSLTVDYGSKGTKTYNTGDSLLEAVDWAHNGKNNGTIPVRILTVYSGAEGVANSEPAPAAK